MATMSSSQDRCALSDLKKPLKQTANTEASMPNSDFNRDLSLVTERHLINCYTKCAEYEITGIVKRVSLWTTEHSVPTHLSKCFQNKLSMKLPDSEIVSQPLEYLWAQNDQGHTSYDL